MVLKPSFNTSNRAWIFRACYIFKHKFIVMNSIWPHTDWKWGTPDEQSWQSYSPLWLIAVGLTSTSKLREWGVSGFIRVPAMVEKCSVVPHESPLNPFSIQIVSEHEPRNSDLDQGSDLAPDLVFKRIFNFSSFSIKMIVITQVVITTMWHLTVVGCAKTTLKYGPVIQILSLWNLETHLRCHLEPWQE